MCYRSARYNTMYVRCIHRPTENVIVVRGEWRSSPGIYGANDTLRSTMYVQRDVPDIVMESKNYIKSDAKFHIIQDTDKRYRRASPICIWKQRRVQPTSTICIPFRCIATILAPHQLIIIFT